VLLLPFFVDIWAERASFLVMVSQGRPCDTGAGRMRTLCYAFAAMAMIAVAAGMGKSESPAQPEAKVELAQAVTR
jgi:hypothetical protein